MEVLQTKRTQEPLQAYNLTVADFHTYFVKAEAGNDAVWVHNNCWDGLPSGAVNTGKTTPDGRELVTFKDANGNQVTAYQGTDGRWYNPQVYSPNAPIPKNVIATPQPGDVMLGANGATTASKTMWKEPGSSARIDVENPNPGQRPGQIHYQDASGKNKYYYDPATEQFYVGPISNGVVASKSVQELLNNPAIINGINKALSLLGVNK